MCLQSTGFYYSVFTKSGSAHVYCFLLWSDHCTWVTGCISPLWRGLEKYKKFTKLHQAVNIPINWIECSAWKPSPFASREDLLTSHCAVNVNCVSEVENTNDAENAVFSFNNSTCVWDVFPWQAQEEMAWRIAKMIVNDVMQQAHCEQRSEKGTTVRGGRMHASVWPEPRCGRSRALTCFLGASEMHTARSSDLYDVKNQRLDSFQPTYRAIGVL